MKNILSKIVYETLNNWWLSLIIGVLSLLLGIVFILQLSDLSFSLTYFFITGFFMVGMGEIAFTVVNQDYIPSWGLGLVSGILDILLGIILLLIPLSDPLIIAFFIGFWGIFHSIWAIEVLRRLNILGIKGSGYLLFLYILCFLFSFALVISPIYISAFTIIMGAYPFIVYGIFRIYLSIKFRSFKNEVDG